VPECSLLSGLLRRLTEEPQADHNICREDGEDHPFDP